MFTCYKIRCRRVFPLFFRLFSFTNFGFDQKYCECLKKYQKRDHREVRVFPSNVHSHFEHILSISLKQTLTRARACLCWCARAYFSKPIYNVIANMKNVNGNVWFSAVPSIFFYFLCLSKWRIEWVYFCFVWRCSPIWFSISIHFYVYIYMYYLVYLIQSIVLSMSVEILIDRLSLKPSSSASLYHLSPAPLDMELQMWP